MRELKTSTAQVDNSNTLSPNKIELHDHSSSLLFYNITIHFNRHSMPIFPLTCLFYRREVSFTIYHTFVLVYITLFQLSTLYSVVYLVCKSKHVCNFFHKSSPQKLAKMGFQAFCLKLCIFLALHSPTITPIRRKNAVEEI